MSQREIPTRMPTIQTIASLYRTVLKYLSDEPSGRSRSKIAARRIRPPARNPLRRRTSCAPAARRPRRPGRAQRFTPAPRNEFASTPTRYSKLEYDDASGERGKRNVPTALLLAQLFGAEAAI